ncbi:MAG TPA: hypothetical protein VKO18_01100 [Terriglobia bacterium]|nr:hypothetical protein [Terriglobia bacterium]
MTKCLHGSPSGADAHHNRIGSFIHRAIWPSGDLAIEPFLARTRVFLLILLPCSVPALAQTVPGFSGVFLRNLIERDRPFADPADPLVLTIKQGVDNLQITEMQNGAQRTYVYDVGGKPSIHVTPDGVYTKDQIKFKGGRLLIKSEVVVDPIFADRLTGETWELCNHGG